MPWGPTRTGARATVSTSTASATAMRRKKKAVCAVTLLLHKAGIHDVVDTVNRDRGLCNVGGDDDLA